MRLAPRPVTHLSTTLLVIIALLAALAPFATDIYLPTFPAMAAELGTNATGVQVTLMAFLVGAGVGQLFFGPLSDRFGRRRPLIIGTALCVVAGVATVIAPSIEVLTLARLVQGLSGAAGMVLGRAIISDIAKGREAARAFNLTSIVLGIAPVAAPLVGALLADRLGWRGLMAIVVGVSVVTLAAVVFFVPETHPTHEPQPLPRAARSGERSGLRSGVYLGNMLTMVFAFGAMMAYISASPFVYQVMIGMDELGYGLLFGVTAFMITVTSYISARLTVRVRTHLLLRIGVLTLVGSAVVLAALVISPMPAWSLVVPLFTGVSAMGLIFGNATALALAAAPRSAGTASALLGAGQFILGACVTPLVTLDGETSAVPLAVVFGVSALLSLVALWFARRAHTEQPASSDVSVSAAMTPVAVAE